MLSLIVNPDDNIRPRVLSPAELANPQDVLNVPSADVIYIDASIAMWVDEDYLSQDREDFNASATFLVRHFDYTFPSLRGPVLLCALRDDGTIGNFTPHAALKLRHLISDLLNN